MQKNNGSIIAALLFSVIGLSAVFASDASAQSYVCPSGYVCTPLVQVTGCPSGYLCTPAQGNTSSGAPANSAQSTYSNGYYYQGGSYGNNPSYTAPAPTVITNVSVNPSFAPVPEPACYTFSVNMGLGSSGNDVARLQAFLMNRGFAIPSVSSGATSRGYFGTQTAAALAAYQASVGLSGESGYAGPLTRARINSLCNTNMPTVPTTPVPTPTTPPTTTGINLSPSNQTVASGQNVQLTFTYPQNTTRAYLYLSCPVGVTLAASRGNLSACNTYADVLGSLYTTFLLNNNSGSRASVVANYTVYTSDNPSYARGQSGTIVVEPGATSVPTPPANQTGLPTTTFLVQPSSIVQGQILSLTSTTNSPSGSLRSAAIDMSNDNINWVSGSPCAYWNSSTGADSSHVISCGYLPPTAGTYYFRSRGTDRNGSSVFAYQTVVVGSPVYGNTQAPTTPTTPATPAPITGTLNVSSTCLMPGANALVTASVTGDGITSKVLEKDTNTDGVFGQAATWGTGPGTHSYITAEPSTYSGRIDLKLLVNGIVKATRSIDVATQCAYR